MLYFYIDSINFIRRPDWNGRITVCVMKGLTSNRFLEYQNYKCAAVREILNNSLMAKAFLH